MNYSGSAAVVAKCYANRSCFENTLITASHERRTDFSIFSELLQRVSLRIDSLARNDELKDANGSSPHTVGDLSDLGIHLGPSCDCYESTHCR